jgi:UDP-N-acetylglucosamine 2-epimerase (non-hydrolysing)
MKKILTIFGTRPEAIKMAPVIKELEKYPNEFQSIVCVTAQHRQLLDQVLGFFEILPRYDLDIMKPDQDLFDITCNVLQGFKSIIREEKPDIVLVHGDTTTTMAASLAAFYCQVKLGHVEAGLRTHNKYAPFPEEINRKVTGNIADYHFSPTQQAKGNLLKEGVSEKTIFVTGNTVIDALILAVNTLKSNSLGTQIGIDLVRRFPFLKETLEHNQSDEGKRIILVTGHRRENFGKGFEDICKALALISQMHPDVDIIYPVHLNPKVQEPVYRLLNDYANIKLVEPLDYPQFIYLMEKSYLIITDSGGVQEEASSLGKPVLVMRETTERAEAVIAGNVKLVGTDPAKILEQASILLGNKSVYQEMSKIRNTFGDGTAAKKIVKLCLEI